MWKCKTNSASWSGRGALTTIIVMICVMEVIWLPSIALMPKIHLNKQRLTAKSLIEINPLADSSVCIQLWSIVKLNQNDCHVLPTNQQVPQWNVGSSQLCRPVMDTNLYVSYAPCWHITSILPVQYMRWLLCLGWWPSTYMQVRQLWSKRPQVHDLEPEENKCRAFLNSAEKSRICGLCMM